MINFSNISEGLGHSVESVTGKKKYRQGSLASKLLTQYVSLTLEAAAVEQVLPINRRYIKKSEATATGFLQVDLAAIYGLELLSYTTMAQNPSFPHAELKIKYKSEFMSSEEKEGRQKQITCRHR